jgi:hypothetical protein
MPLSLLPPDPEPTPAELERFEAEELKRAGPNPNKTDRDLASGLAFMRWRNALLDRDRNTFLVPSALEVDGYPAYLNSPLWRKIQRETLKAADHKCAGCSAKATQVHHRDYRPRVLSGEDRAPLVPLCAACHTNVDKEPSGKARDDWPEKERILAEMVAKEDERLIMLAEDSGQAQASGS